MPDSQAVLEMMTTAEAVYLATVRDGAPRIRAMVNLRHPESFPGISQFCRAQGFVCYFATSLASGKVDELRADSSASVYFADPRSTHGIELRGKVEVLTDPGLRRTLWQEVWRVYWPSGETDPDYAVLRFAPWSACGWWGTEPFRLELSSQ